MMRNRLRPAIGIRIATALSQRRALTTEGRRLVLGIESSCDDSCAALVHADPSYSSPSSSGPSPSARIAENVVLRQDHGVTQGIQPLVAAHLHSSNVPLAITQCLSQARRSGLITSPDGAVPQEIDAIAVTRGPGMAGCLSVGLNNAKLLSALWNKPLVYVHHMAAHALTPFLTRGDATKPSSSLSKDNAAPSPPLRFPFLCLLLSGGHTLLVLVRSVSSFRILATTSDDSIGDAFDKAAKWLDVPTDWNVRSPGAALESFAANQPHASLDGSSEGQESELYRDFDFEMAVAMRNEAGFSYSGLKANVLQKIEKARELSKRGPGEALPEYARRRLAQSFQKAALAQISDKVRMALAPPPTVRDGDKGVDKERARDKRLDLDGVEAKNITHLVVSGGVASNLALRRSLAETLQGIGRSDVILDFPTPALCVDNAAMIAHAALMDWRPTSDLTASPRAKWSLEDLEQR